MSLIEVCVDNYESAINAYKNGADRIELCADLLEGGITPSYGMIKRVISKVKIPVAVMIRPRGGNFEYSSNEIEIMKYDIRIAKECGAYAVVLGTVKNKKIDLQNLNVLINEAKPMKVTFHMAFDEIKDKFKGIDDLIKVKVDRILTTGGCKNALYGVENLKKLINYAGDKIIIVPGKGITNKNRNYVQKVTGAVELHGSKIL